MSRYRGPRVKQMRAVGMELPGLSRKTIERKPNPPGMREGQFKRKKSEFGTQLLEKQKLRFNYGIREKYLRKLVREAFRSKGHSGNKILEFLESRLDSVVFRAGFAPTIPAARQLIGHKHVLVDGKKVNIPSFRIEVGQKITVSEKGRKIPAVASSLESPPLARPAWMTFDTSKTEAQIITIPDRDSLPFPIEISLVAEYYSRSVR